MGTEVGIRSDGSDADYYRLPEGATELADLIEHKNMNFNRGNIFKAAYRLGEKADVEVEYDLNKIIYAAIRERDKVRRERLAREGK